MRESRTEEDRNEQKQPPNKAYGKQNGGEEAESTDAPEIVG